MVEKKIINPKEIAFLFLLAIMPLFSFGQYLSATVDKQVVTVGEYFQITWELVEAEGDVSLPNLKPFEVVQGPMRSSNYTYVNGKVSSSVSESYVLQATKEGTFNIESASARLRSGDVKKSNILTIKVIKGNTNNVAKGGNQPRGNSNKNTDGEYFIKASVDKASVVVGEPVVVTYTFMLRNVGLEQFALRKMPQFNGFWSKDLPNQTDKQLREDIVDGKKFYVAIVKKAILYPQRSGQLSIDPIEAEAIITLKSKQKTNNPFFDDPFFNNMDDFFQTQQAVRKTLTSTSVNLTVRPLPEQNKPSNFSGLVGNFRLKTSVNKTKVKANDALTYTVTVEGNGNIQQVQPFTLNLPPDWDVYDPKTLDKTGSRTFEYTIIPKSEGKYSIPALDFSYYDLSTRNYKTLSSQEIGIEVLKGAGGSVASSSANLRKEDVKLLGKDIRYIKTEASSFEKNSASFYGSAMYWSLSSVPFVAFIGLVAFKRRREKELSDVAGYRRKSATGVARKRLKKASALMKSNKKEEFYKEILQATYGYLSDTLGLQVADITKDSLRNSLAKSGVNSDVIDSSLKSIDNFEFAAYAPSLGSSNLQEVYSEAERVINSLENQIKKGV